ncbi:MAG: hypothetical protein BMS9Abin05_1989 [Rhodothermia bacterium]|nr:MAG: hypothetical protein BMS9Abin05_1989 [Rhodothermia bacterium]
MVPLFEDSTASALASASLEQHVTTAPLRALQFPVAIPTVRIAENLPPVHYSEGLIEKVNLYDWLSLS